MLAGIVAVLVAGGLFALRWPRTASVLSLSIAGVLAVASEGQTFRAPWIPALGIEIHLASDGLTFALILLTVLLGLAASVASFGEIRERAGFFHLNLLWVLAGIAGVFLARDFFLFYFFWELMLVPMYFLIGIWGHGHRVRAAIQFFLFTQAGGLFLLTAFIALYFLHHRATGVYTFDSAILLATPLTRSQALWIALGFSAAFAVKLPAVPFHTWLPDAHTEAPTAASVVLAGLLLKTGGYGFIRFVLPIGADLALAAQVVGVAGILYGAVLAFAQTDAKRMVAYTSVSHMGFVLVGVFAGSARALDGAVLQMLCHGLSTGALFLLVGMIQQRLHTRDLARMGGFLAGAPRLGALLLFFALASLGLPGLGNFVAEFLVLAGTFPARPWVAAGAAAGLVLAAAYSLVLFQRIAHGPPATTIPDLRFRDAAILGVFVVLLVWLGVYPRPILELV